jgi:hypothetical protein
VPGQIDIMILYLFYFFEESKKNTLVGITRKVDLVNAFADIEELSVSALLSEYAHQIMEALGIDPHPKFQEIKPVPKKANKKQNEINTPPQKKNNVTEKIQQPFKSQEIEKAVVVTEKDSALIPKKLSPPTMQLNDEISSKGKWLNSLANQGGTNIRIKLEKGHRSLDTLARLLSREMAFGGDCGPVGSVSVALFSTGGKNKLLISTKDNRANNNAFIALTKVISYSNKLGLYVKDFEAFLELRKRELKEIALELKSCTNDKEEAKLIKRKYQARQDIDKIKLYLSLNYKGDDKIRQLFKTTLSNISVNNVVIIKNPFNLHSELNAIKYLLENNFILSYTASASGLPVPYQYIGGSILNCAKCSALIKGGENIVGINSKSDNQNLVFFSRGNYRMGYPNFVIPKWSSQINNKSKIDMAEALDKLSSPASKLSVKTLMQIQDASLSESE